MAYAGAFVPLWCKSNFSFLEGASHPEELVQAARELGLPALALTDRDGVYGAARAHVAARESGVRLIIGSQITVDEAHPVREAAACGAVSRIVLLAQDRGGYANLCRLISRGRLRSPKGSSSVGWKEVAEHSCGLIALWSPLWGGCGDPAALLREAFGDRLYVPVSRHRLAGESEAEERLAAAAARLGAPLVAAPQVLYHTPGRRRLQDVLTAIRCGVSLEAAGTRLQPNDRYALLAPVEAAALYRDLPDALARTAEIAGRCRFSLAEIVYRYPAERLPDGVSSYEWLRELTFRGARGRYGGTVPADVGAQLERELALINELDYCGYFLTMWDIVEICRSRGILCQGRGSAANSAVCYCLGITAIDPVRMDLLFERFLSRERAEPPDIDLDIEHRRREEVIQHVYAKYGRDHAAMVANVVRYRPRSAVREVGKALGFPATTLDRLARMLSWRDGDITDALVEAGLDPEARASSLLIDLVREICDFPRHLSIHPGGFLLGAEPVTDLVPVENATMADRTVIQWDKYDVEALGLFKVDLLGLGALSQLDYAFRLLKRHRGVELSMATIPADDPEVFAMASRADTVGVFQIESRAQMAMLPRLRPRSFYDLVIEVSIVRPGPITGGMVHPYLRRRAGEEPVEYPHPSLEPVLRKTLGVPLFQEQVMKLAVVAADYTPGEADQLRRDMAAWRRSGRIEGHGERIVSRMMRKGIAREFAERVFDQIRGFGEYGFPESHAASFALIAYCTAWLRCHYPAEFTCALLNAWPMGFYAPATIVEDARRHGLEVRPVDVLASDWECTLEPEGAGAAAAAPSPASRFAVRMGLRYVKGLGEGDWKRIEAARRPGVPSLAAFAAASGLDEAALEALAAAGALASLGVERRDALWSVAGAGRRRAAAADGGVELGLGDPEIAPDLEGLTSYEEISWDYGASGHSTRGHPLEPYRSELAARGLPDAAALSAAPDGSRASYAGLVICRQRPGTAGGVVFMTLEDESGFVNLVVWEKVFNVHRKVILTSWVLGVTGKIQSRDGTVHLIVESCWKPELSSAPARISSRDFH